MYQIGYATESVRLSLMCTVVSYLSKIQDDPPVTLNDNFSVETLGIHFPLPTTFFPPQAPSLELRLPLRHLAPPKYPDPSTAQTSVRDTLTPSPSSEGKSLYLRYQRPHLPEKNYTHKSTTSIYFLYVFYLNMSKYILNEKNSFTQYWIESFSNRAPSKIVTKIVNCHSLSDDWHPC